VIDTTDGHRRFQTGMLALAMLAPLLITGMYAAYKVNRQRMPRAIELAGGLEGGIYDELSQSMGRRMSEQTGVEVSVIASGGSIDNHRRLVDGEVDLAPMQAIAMTNGDVCVVAPLFFEAVHVLVRQESSVQDANEIAGHRVAVGLAGSGSRLATEMVLESLGLSAATTPRVAVAYSSLSLDGPNVGESLPDVAVICIGKGSRLASSMLNTGQWRLIPLKTAIEISLLHPSLRPMTISAVDYPDAELPKQGIATVGMTAFLAAKSTAPSALVTAALEALYQPPTIAPGLIPRHQIHEWQGLNFHSAARKFFEHEDRSL